MLRSAAPLIQNFDGVTMDIARARLSGGWTSSDHSPNTLEDLIAYFHANGENKLDVTNAVPDSTVFGSQKVLEGFRAWHDEIHVRAEIDGTFDLPGELRVAHAHAADIMLMTGDSPDGRAMAALALIQVYQQNVYWMATNGVRVVDERRMALQYFAGWNEYADEMFKYVFYWVAKGCPLNRRLALTFEGDLPNFGASLDASKSYRV